MAPKPVIRLRRSPLHDCDKFAIHLGRYICCTVILHSCGCGQECLAIRRYIREDMSRLPRDGYRGEGAHQKTTLQLSSEFPAFNNEVACKEDFSW